MSKFLDENGLLYLVQKIKTWLSGKADSSHTHSTSDLTDYTEYQLPTASSSTLGGIKIGSNLNIESDGTLNAEKTEYNEATTSNSGLMSSTDKTKLDGIEESANNYSLPTASSSVLGGIKVGSGLTISSAGTLSATGGGTADAVAWENVTDKPDFADVATSGSYNDLTDIPILATVATTGAYSDLIGTPSIPTAVSSLTNDSGYQTASDVSTAITNAISGITGISYSVVTSLPTTGEAGVIYLLANEQTETSNIYDEYIYVNSAFEKIGTTAVDLSDYLKSEDVQAITNSEIDTICA